MKPLSLGVIWIFQEKITNLLQRHFDHISQDFKSIWNN